ncbi:MAG TPA: flagellar hook-length control protein FliK [Pseudolabrys sp.]|nr:flagellar hook-length control protein FliK [Pseudolabrys sp.]
MPPFASESAAAAAFQPLSSPSRFNKGPKEPETPFASLLDGASENPSPDNNSPPPKQPMNDHSAASPPNNDTAGKTVGRNDCNRTQSKAVQNDGDSTDGAEKTADAKSSDGAPADPGKKTDSTKPTDDSNSDDDKNASDACKAADTALVQAAADAATATPSPAPIVQVIASPVAAPIIAALAAQDSPAQTATSDESAKPAGPPDKTGASAAATTKLALLKDASTTPDVSKTAEDTATAADQTNPSGSQSADGSGKQKPAQPASADDMPAAAKADVSVNADNGIKSDAANVPATAATAAAPADDGKDAAAKNAGARPGDNADKPAADLAHFDIPALPGGDGSLTANTGAPQTQQIQLAQPTIAAATNSPAPNGTLVPPAVPIAGLAVEIAGRALAGKNHFEIRLDPPDLGRIDVHLNVDRNGQVTSHLVVDRPDTLNLLRQDSTGLERALQDAGLKTSDNGLQFSLRDQTMNQNGNMPAPAPAIARVVVPDDAMPAVELPQRIYSRLAGMGGGLDIRV